MTPRFILPLLFTGPLLAQDAARKAETDLRLATEQLRQLKSEIIKKETPLIRRVEQLDDRAIALGKELNSSLAGEKAIAGEQRKLDNELASRRGEFDYTLSSLRSYGRNLKNRIHSAEKQTYGKLAGEAEAKATAAGDDLVQEVRERLAVLGIGARRIREISGGHQFSGSAVAAGNVVKEGDFTTFGPLGYFLSKDGGTVGLTNFTPDSLDFPGIISMNDEQGGGAIADLIKTGSAQVPVDATMGKALQVARTKKSLKDYLKGGGVVGYGILGLGALAMLIALYKLLEITRFPLPSRKRINLVLDDLLENRSGEAEEKAGQIKGLGGQMVQAGVQYFYDKRRILEDALLEKLGAIQPRLERFLPFLALVAAAAPMMGLLGTVLGIMKTFAMMSAVGTGDSRAFSAGISEALITTAMGLIVAIPVIIIHGMLKSLAKAKFGQAEGVALSILNGTTEIDKSAEVPGGDDPDEIDELELAPA